MDRKAWIRIGACLAGVWLGNCIQKAISLGVWAEKAGGKGVYMNDTASVDILGLGGVSTLIVRIQVGVVDVFR